MLFENLLLNFDTVRLQRFHPENIHNHNASCFAANRHWIDLSPRIQVHTYDFMFAIEDTNFIKMFIYH